MIDENGYVVRSQYTDNSDAAVYENCRLVLDVYPEFDSNTHGIKRIEPISKNSNKVEYEIFELQFEILPVIDYEIEENKIFEQGTR